MEYWHVPKIWDGGECWIIGGGSSLPRQFGVDEKIIQKVSEGKAPLTVYSEYMKPIHDKHVIGVNVAFMLGDWISAMYFCDRSFFRNYTKEMLAFHNIKATCVNHLDRDLLPYSRNIKRLKRDYNRYGFSGRSDTICWNHNSGGAAIDFAVHLGVKRIILLGFDMKRDGNKSHWHTGLPTYQNVTPPATYRRFLRAFPTIAQHAKANNIEILNVSPDSAIKDFRKVQLKDLI